MTISLIYKHQIAANISWKNWVLIKQITMELWLNIKKMTLNNLLLPSTVHKLHMLVFLIFLRPNNQLRKILIYKLFCTKNILILILRITCKRIAESLLYLYANVTSLYTFHVFSPSSIIYVLDSLERTMPWEINLDTYCWIVRKNPNGKIKKQIPVIKLA